MDESTREALCAAAVKAAKAVDYVGAGTIEFIADAGEGLRADRIWFMEMNTRLQVEHPVTEEITGVDLVEWQLRVASGEPLPKRQDELSINGWAMEARLYAEDPAKGFLPSIGKLTRFTMPSHTRVDTGVEMNDAVSPFYDPMIAKVIVSGRERGLAIRSLKRALDLIMVWPVRSNQAFLGRLLRLEAFKIGDVDTGLIERNLELLVTPRPITKADTGTALWSMELIGDWDSRAKVIGPAGFRLNAAPHTDVLMVDDRGERHWASLDDPWGLSSDEVDGEIVTYVEGEARGLSLFRAMGGHSGSASDGAILAPMPGKVIAVEVAAGDTVTKGQKLLVLEAMKMEHALTAPFDGTVAELTVAVGAQVQVEALLVRVEKAE
jgi:3-methylcrotonyl-CoA carboxylase alpha subunit